MLAPSNVASGGTLCSAGVADSDRAEIRNERARSLHPTRVTHLFPAGEGAGYAGGILSAGVDGIRTAEAVALDIVSRAAPAP
ncbi:hypothetical protein [Agrilutibacter solisilvae]|uniref:Amine oxidase domain-containing protein n=1 Tax=Agrilutibacter solisilvae TaxID=2763317 RepID=A0A975ATS0_9GAMM|nr:hypothetical protein [Lysobacter solisilvae]QSX80137.1 hypothetical protein I8J32_007865 [Lysobacter solisilvae]